jgi:pSer/pThr/pTyr-binding forkhead associated (FHA) protein
MKDVKTVKSKLPYLKKIEEYADFSTSHMNDVVRDLLSKSAQLPCYLEVSNGSSQYFLFFREKQIYSAGMIEDGHFKNLAIKDFFLSTSQMSSVAATSYEVNSKILHSLLIMFQKKASLRLLTSMVDLDEVLDRIEEDGKSCIVVASQDEFLAVLRYEKGQVTALGHEHSFTAPKENNFREDFLVKIYTLSAEQQFSIAVYEDLLVKYAADAKMIDDKFVGDVTELYLSKPPIITLTLKDREIGHWVMDRPSMNIGRTAENDIQIDNLAVSRLHAILEKDKGRYYIKDCDSLNGTLVNGKRIGRAQLQPGDRISLGKHVLKIQKQTGMEIAAGVNPEPFDQTVIITADTPRPPVPLLEHLPAQQDEESDSVPRLVERTKSGDVVFELRKPTCLIGKDYEADIEIAGFFVAAKHAEIVHENGDFVLRHINGRRKVSVDGQPIKEKVLKNNVSIKIGKREFVFQE